jgi:hypothetical protein
MVEVTILLNQNVFLFVHVKCFIKQIQQMLELHLNKVAIKVVIFVKVLSFCVNLSDESNIAHEMLLEQIKQFCVFNNHGFQLFKTNFVLKSKHQYLANVKTRFNLLHIFIIIYKFHVHFFQKICYFLYVFNQFNLNFLSTKNHGIYKKMKKYK